ncbi:hypothetical protein J2S74_003288 [Evansella vedderi]|uniref:Uncharacterized protein n=1 Tax=Evansella vedderi TaxID=38282 RepID=A0ABT9ZXE9_9BACI|nr:hypothetical protein [Evansella vedderi]
MPAENQDGDITPLPTGRGLPLGVIGPPVAYPSQLYS